MCLFILFIYSLFFEKPVKFAYNSNGLDNGSDSEFPEGYRQKTTEEDQWTLRPIYMSVTIKMLIIIYFA